MIVIVSAILLELIKDSFFVAPLNQSLKAGQTKCAQKFQRIRYFVNLDRLKPSSS